MITTARRPRYYVARVIYGVILLYMLWDQQRNWDLFRRVDRGFRFAAGGTMGRTPEEVRRFAESAFISFAGVQGFVLLCLIPALVAGVIADEYQRKTLHYLLASRLTSVEIVLGKLAARLLHVGSFVALGLPVVSLLGLYGGLNPDYVFYCYLGTATMVLFVAGLSMLISIVANRPRDAILATYGLLAIWLWVPRSISGVVHAIGGPLFWVGTVNDWLLISNPIVAWSELTRGPGLVPRMAAVIRGRFAGHFYEMVGLQTGLGLLFLFLAIVGLRPLRGSAWPVVKPNSGWGSRILRLVRSIGRSNLAAPVLQNQILAARGDRPPCGDRPMLWKERFARPSGGLGWLSSPIVLIFCSVALGCYFFDVIRPAVAEIVQAPGAHRNQTELNVAVCESSIVLAVLAMLSIAASASVSLTGEREGDTWASLATTLLTPAEIVGGKQFGAMWSACRIGAVLVIIWMVGLLLRGIDPWNLLAATVLLVSGAWLIASLGVFVSSRARNGTRALFATFVVMFAIGWIWPNWLWQSLASGHDPARAQSQFAAGPTFTGSVTFEAIRNIAILAGLQAGAAAALTFGAIRRVGARWETR
jgi:ABC-type transport system involved in multi-copper enzyme maturation permease subunit